MSIESALKINNWKDQMDDVEKSVPELCHCFATMWNTEQIHRDEPMKALKYLDYEADLDADSLYGKFIGNRTVNLVNKADEKVGMLKQWMKANSFNSCMAETEIITYSNVLSSVMNTPFEVEENKKNFDLIATVDSQNKIYLVQSTENAISSVLNKLNQNLRPAPTDYRSTLEKRCEKLKQYLFVRWPINHYRNVTSTLDRNFYELYRLNIGEHKIMYAAELPGIISYEKVSDLNDLKAAEHIVCDAYYTDEISHEVVSYNPLWWSKACLINAKQCFIGICDKTNDNINGIMKFSANKFAETAEYEHLWSPKASWKFLDSFLTFVKDEINRVTSNRKSFLWKFKIIDNGCRFVICEPRFVDNKLMDTSAKLEHFM